MNRQIEFLSGNREENTNSANRLYGRFLDLCGIYARLGERAGVAITPYRKSSTQRFLELPDPICKAIVSNLETTISIYASALDNGVDIHKCSLASVWWGMKKLGLKPSSSLFADLTDGDVIEIYNCDNIQIFRTFNLFECLSYSIEELFTYEWWELFYRDSHVTSRIQEVASGLLQGRIREPIRFGNASHIVTEIFSPNRNRAETRLNLMAPLRDYRGAPAGYLSSMRIIHLFTDENQTTLS
jgi:hypothetical protein